MRASRADYVPAGYFLQAEGYHRVEGKIRNCGGRWTEEDPQLGKNWTETHTGWNLGELAQSNGRTFSQKRELCSVGSKSAGIATIIQFALAIPFVDSVVSDSLSGENMLVKI